MYVRLAWRNVRRSARDYAIFFLTLLIGVAMFYAFNSIGSQSVLFDIQNSAHARMIQLTEYLMGIFSALVALVLAFLVVYANRFIVKRRKHEFGTCLLLGMSSGKVARVLLYEMLIVGMGSLAVGLACGIALSQGLAFVTAALMGTTMTGFTFIVSGKAIVLTLVCFAAMFFVTLIMNVIYVSRTRLSKLLAMRESGSQPKTVRTWLRVVVFVLSLGILAVAYWCLWKNGFLELGDGYFVAATVLMVVGTALLFWSGSTVVMAILMCARGFYLRNLRAFTLRQVSSKMGTAFASLTVVCVMLFFALTTMSVGFALVDLFVGDIEACTRYDITIGTGARLLGRTDASVDSGDEDSLRAAFAEQDWRGEEGAAESDALFREYDGDCIACFADRCPGWDEVVERAVQLDCYLCPGLTWGDVIEQGFLDTLDETIATFLKSNEVSFIALSQFNDTMELAGLPKLALEEGQCAIDNTNGSSNGIADYVREQGLTIDYAGISLTVSPQKLACELNTTSFPETILQVIVPDSVITKLRQWGACPSSSYVNVMLTQDRDAGSDAFFQMLSQGFPVDGDGYVHDESGALREWPVQAVYTAYYMAAQAGGLRMAVTYLAVFIGFVLLVSTAAVLAIQQMSEVADSTARYRRLASLGCDKRMLLGSLRTQTALYFLAPLAVALCHTAYAVFIIGRAMALEIGVNISASTLGATGALLAIYLCYLFVSYRVSRRIVCEACDY